MRMARLIATTTVSTATNICPARNNHWIAGSSMTCVYGLITGRSGKPLSDPIPALFTQPVFKHEVDKGIEQSVAQFAADDWVFGANKIDAVQKAQLAQQVLGLYEQDYIKAWDDVLADLQLQPINNIQDASAIAAKLAGPNSPLKLLLKVVRDNTSDLMRAPPGDAADKAEDVAKKLAQKRATQTALARALALDPDIVFLDEPTSGLDPIAAASFDQLIRTLRDALGLTVFMITHDLDSLHAICDRVAVLAHKRVIVADSLDKVERFDDPWIRQYFQGPRGRAAQSVRALA